MKRPALQNKQVVVLRNGPGFCVDFEHFMFFCSNIYCKMKLEIVAEKWKEQ